MMAWILRLVSGVPYLFDMRGYWIDERVAERRWFTYPFVYKLAKRFELKLLRDSVGIIVLTQLMADDLRAKPLRNWNSGLLTVVPTCADYDEFKPENKRGGMVLSEVQSRLHNSLVIGWVGSLNASYYPHESVLLFRYVLEQIPTAHLLALTRQRTQLEMILANHGIPRWAHTIVTVPHDEMPAWLSLMDWGLLLVSDGQSKRGSMPTKLAEFFASEVRPIQYGCNAELAEKVQQAGTGLVLNGLSENDLRRAASEIASRPRDQDATKRGRNSTRQYFGLEAGVDKYAAVLDKILVKEIR
jgi:glycosyltransferase involved in cell wall biosynthesis